MYVLINNKKINIYKFHALFNQKREFYKKIIFFISGGF